MARRVITFATDSEVRINRRAIAGLTAPGGEVYDWCDRRARPAVVQNIRRRVPVRTGRLYRSVRVEMRKLNQNSCTVFAAAGGHRAHYAAYVDQGTSGPILPGSGNQWLTLYADDRQVGGSRYVDAQMGGYLPFYKSTPLFVSGQDANHFMENGVEAAMTQLGVNL